MCSASVPAETLDLDLCARVRGGLPGDGGLQAVGGGGPLAGDRTHSDLQVCSPLPIKHE